MKFVDRSGPCPVALRTLAAALFLICTLGSPTAAFGLAPPPATAQALAPAKAVGTIKTVSGNTLVLTSDAGTELTILVPEDARLVQVAPGQKDLKDALPIQLQVLQPGDRILVRGKPAPDGKSLVAASIFSMKQSDLAQKQAKDREEWRSHGLGGVVSEVDPAAGKITLTLSALGEKRSAVVVLSKQTITRRYAPDSVKFDDARIASLDQIKPGDQLRARGTKNSDGSELAATEIVSGTFRNIAGLISKVDAAASTVTVEDAVAKKLVTIRITAESQLRKLPPPMAQRIALRLKGAPAEALRSAPGAGGSGNPAAAPGAPAGPGRAGGGPQDLQQAMSRLPALTLADLQKGEAVMVVATEGSPVAAPFAITLLSGVELILEASPKSSASTLLSPWSLSGSEGGEGSNP